MSEFDDARELGGDGLRLRPLAASDRDALYAAANDPKIWAGHPAKNRHERETFDPYFDFLIAVGGALAILKAETGEIIGCSRYYVSPDAPAAISIGFTFLATKYWGGAWNFRLKRLMLDHAFKTFVEVWFHIAPDNLRSRKATAKLGAVFEGEEELDLAGTLARWARYRLTREVWARRREVGGAS